MEIKIEAGEIFAAHQDCIYALCTGPEEGTFFSSGADGNILMWTLKNNEIARVVCRTGMPVYSLIYLPLQDLLIAGQRDGGIHFIRVIEKQIMKSVQVHTKPIFDLKLLPDGRILAASGDGSFSVWNLEEYACDIKAEISSSSLRCLAIHENTSRMAVAGSDLKIRVYNLENLKLMHTLEGHSLSVFSLTFTPDGKRLISTGRDARFCVWNTDTFTEIENIPAHLFAVNHLLLCPSGKYLASASMDKSVKIWETQSLKLLKVIERPRFFAHTSSVNRLLWLSENQLLSAGDDRKIFSWQTADTSC